MSNYKFILTYDGTKYYGWEHQPKVEETIQGKMESVLSRMLDEDVEVIGCGRTDAGGVRQLDEQQISSRQYLRRFVQCRQRQISRKIQRRRQDVQIHLLYR